MSKERAHADPGRAVCGCGTDGGARRAVAVDPETKETTLRRLRRVEGQVRGIANMVEEDRYCADIVTQVMAVQEALRGVSRRLMLNHLKHCATRAIRAGDEEADAMYEELVALMFKGAR